MKVTIKEPGPHNTDLPYPKLMRSIRGSAIVLMTDESVGMELHDGARCVGRYLESWAMSCFEDFHGTVTIENED